jgi:L-iditol 2-dehydrogenase
MFSYYLIEPGILDLRELKKPEPDYGEVLVRIKAALTCGTDLKAYLRGHPMIPMPGVFGHEFSGIIEKIGKGVRNFKIGDEIMAVHSAPCHKCIYCKKRFYNLCENIMKTKVLGAFSEYILLPAHIVKENLFHKPSNISFEEAAFLEPLSCVVHSIKKVDIKKGDVVLIIGAGPIGLLHISLTKLKGAKVIVTALEPERLKLAESLGADKAIPPSEVDKTIENLTEGIGVDFVFECTGQLSVWESAINYVRKGGTIILFGGVKSGTKVSYDTYRLHYDEITLKGVFHFTPQDVKEAYKLLKDTISVTPLISGTFSLKDLPTALEKLSQGEGIKYAIIP